MANSLLSNYKYAKKIIWSRVQFDISEFDTNSVDLRWKFKYFARIYYHSIIRHGHNDEEPLWVLWDAKLTRYDLCHSISQDRHFNYKKKIFTHVIWRLFPLSLKKNLVEFLNSVSGNKLLNYFFRGNHT